MVDDAVDAGSGYWQKFKDFLLAYGPLGAGALVGGLAMMVPMIPGLGQVGFVQMLFVGSYMGLPLYILWGLAAGIAVATGILI